MITIADVTAELTYYPQADAWVRNRWGRLAGSTNSQGRFQVRVDGRLYQAHRLVWLLHTGRFPVGEIDHINGDPLDNRISNLREATRAQNTANAKRRRDNSSGYKGVSRNGNRWSAHVGGRNVGSRGSKE